MAQVERKRVIETEGTMPDGREVKRVANTEQIVASGTETRAGVTGQGVSTILIVGVALAFIALLALWYHFFT